MPFDKIVSGEDDSHNNFFNETEAGKHITRAVFIDLAETIVDQVCSGAYRRLYHPDHGQSLTLHITYFVYKVG